MQDDYVTENDGDIADYPVTEGGTWTDELCCTGSGGQITPLG
jgi:hypothetical protein